MGNGIGSGEAPTMEWFSVLLLGLSKSFQKLILLFSSIKTRTMQYALCFFLFQHALIAFQQYAIVIKNSNFCFLEGMNLKWAQKE